MSLSFSNLPWPFGSSSDPYPPVDDDEQDSPPGRHRRVSSLLQHYETPGVPPPSSRVDPTVKQQESQPVRLWHVWKYWALAATKATEMAGDLISHHVWGPRRKSWGVEMTLITSFMRNTGRHSKLADIATLRMLIGLGGLVPLPSDAMVTPVTFRVRRRKLRGILAEYDAAETGSRELSGEWVVGKKLWRRLQAEWKATSVAKDAVKAGHDFSLPKPKKERVLLYLHGGAYFVFSAATHRLLTIPLSKSIGARVFAINYRLAPETRFPGPLHDAVSAYFRLINDLHIPPENILLAGDSAGGGLSLALLMYLRDNQYPLPSGAILFSPWVDLTMSCDSWDSNAEYDVISIPPPGDHLNPVDCYLGENMQKYLTHPYASPLFGDFKGLPPLLIQAGDAEVLRDEITLLAHKATLAGVETRHELYEDAVHVFQVFPFLDTTREAFRSCREFVRNMLPLHQIRSPQILDETAQAELAHEMDNEQARFVGGDGTEVDREKETDDVAAAVVHTQERVDKAQEDATSTRPSIQVTRPRDSDSSDGDSETDPSWRPLNSDDDVPRLPGDGDSEDGPKAVANTVVEVEKPLRRIQTTITMLTKKAKAAGSSISGAGRNHRRSPTSHEKNERDRPTPELLMSYTKPAPAPSIRARHRAASHPDISSLCQQWVSSDPPNQPGVHGQS